MRQFALNQIQAHSAEKVRSLKQTGFRHKSRETFTNLVFIGLLIPLTFPQTFSGIFIWYFPLENKSRKHVMKQFQFSDLHNELTS